MYDTHSSLLCSSGSEETFVHVFPTRKALQTLNVQQRVGPCQQRGKIDSDGEPTKVGQAKQNRGKVDG